MKKRGAFLTFISRINPDGSGTTPVTDQATIDVLGRELFELTCLSITNGTYIASGFNSYVVKLKP